MQLSCYNYAFLSVVHFCIINYTRNLFIEKVVHKEKHTIVNVLSID